MNQAPIIEFDLDIAKDIADQCICHPVSRSVDDIERAGEAIKYLLWVIEKTRATAAVELDRAQRGEPVAWIWRFSDGELHKTPFGTLAECERDASGYDGSAVPLYTAPQPERKPDCRTCHRFISRGDGCNPTFTCVNGSQYVPTVPIHFWETP